MIKVPVHFRHSDDIVEFVKIVSQYPSTWIWLAAIMPLMPSP